MKKVLMKTTTPISPAPTGVCATANGGRKVEKNAPPIIRSAMVPADKALPGTVDKCQASAAEGVHKIAGDQDALRTETIEQRPRRECDHGRRGHDCRQHQPCSRRREAADRVEVDDFERKDQSSAEK